MSNFTVPVYDAKFTVAVIVGDHCPKFLIDLGKRVAAHYEKSEKYADKAEQHRITAGQLLTQAAAMCDEGGFDAFIEKFCPNLGRSRVFELKAIVAGKKSVEDIRASSRERQARCRAGKKAESVTDGNVTDSTPNDDEIERDRKECVGLYEKAVAAEEAVKEYEDRAKAKPTEPEPETGPTSNDKIIHRDWKTGEEYVEQHDGDRAGDAGDDATLHAGQLARQERNEQSHDPRFGAVQGWLLGESAGTIARTIIDTISQTKSDAVTKHLLNLAVPKRAGKPSESTKPLKKLSMEKTVDADGNTVHALEPRGKRSSVH